VTPARALALLAGAVLLAGCPIPQAVPDYPPGSITPPRIVMTSSQITLPDTIIQVPIPCSLPGPEYELTATLRDSNTIESVVARWFVNYEPANLPTVTWQQQDTISIVDPADPTLRAVPTFPFRPYGYPKFNGGPGSGADDGALHVVELVVSNGFDPDGVPTNRSPQPGFEVQLYRWVFLNGPGTCPP
jgi:hypothetical protein